jgi:hypothetical protein
MDMGLITIYKFHHTSDIYADESGNFFRSSDDKLLKKVYHNGRIAIRDGTKYYGIKRLRKNAYKSEKEIIDCPF